MRTRLFGDCNGKGLNAFHSTCKFSFVNHERHLYPDLLAFVGKGRGTGSVFWGGVGVSGYGCGLSILINYILYLSSLLAILPWLGGLSHHNRRQFDFCIIVVAHERQGKGKKKDSGA
jgi:hypothetical protein